MRIYFEMCSLQRPLDDKTQLRVLLEAQAVLAVLALCESGMAETVASDVLVFECDANPNASRRDFADRLIAKATHFIRLSPQIEANAQSLIDAGIKTMDALHLASAVAANASYFCTCDDRFLKKARSLDTMLTKVVSPLELASELQI